MGSSPIRVAKFASVAQSVEQGTENPRVGGSIPPGGTNDTYYKCGSGSVVERHLAKVNVASSNLVFRSIKTESCQSARFCFKNLIWRHSQVVRQRSATPSSPVQIWVAPPYRNKLYLFRFFLQKISRLLRCSSFFRKQERSAYLFVCKRTHDGLLSLPSFYECPFSTICI